jgi:hypothetical protein
MKKINAILFKYLRGEAHYQYLNLFNLLLIEFPAVKSVILSFYDSFVALLAKEKQVVDAQRSSEYTKQIADADHNNDKLITGITEAIKASLHHFDPVIVAAANIIWLRLKAFGDIQSKSYEEESAAITILIDDLKSAEYAPKAEILGLNPWICELKKAVTEFNALLKLRNVEQAGKPQQHLRDIRRQIDEVYHLMINNINSAVTLDSTGAYTEFVNQLNTQIAYFNEHNHHPAPKNLKTAIVNAIPEQEYTGKVITPIPAVFFNDVELFFAKDFTLTYKNNIERGVAEIGIKGKGNYTGKKTVTFNIV